jgi:hypothetical protein
MRQLAADDGADPYLTLGVLVEGVAHILSRHIPPERQEDTASALLDLLSDRLKAHGL